MAQDQRDHHARCTRVEDGVCICGPLALAAKDHHRAITEALTGYRDSLEGKQARGIADNMILIADGVKP